MIYLIQFFYFFSDEFRRVEIIREIPREVSRGSSLGGWGLGDTWASHEGQQAHLGPFGEWKVYAKKTNWTSMRPVCFCDRFLFRGLWEKIDL